MAPRTNPYYADPNLSKSFDNIASIFAPPSATDMYAYAKAASDRAAEARKAQASARLQSGNASVADYADLGISDPAKNYAIADMYGRSRLDPTLTPQALDTGSFAVNGNANNTFAGQRNKLDSDERNKQVEERTKVVTASLTPVADGAVRYVSPAAAPILGISPDSVGSMYQYGPQSVSPGVKVVRPDGTELQGNEPARTVDQVKADELEKLRKPGVNGQPFIPDSQMSAIIFGSTPLQAVRKPDGSSTLATGPEAIGQTPAPDVTKMSELAQLQNERSALVASNPNDPRVKEYDSRIAALGRGQQQGAYDKAMDEDFAKEGNKIYEGAKNANIQRGTIGYLRTLFANPATAQGFAGESQLGVKKAFAAMGIPVGDTSDAEVARALSNKMALVAKNDGGENTMPGSLSDGDRTFLQLMSTNIGNSRDANMKMLDYYDRVQQRQIQVNDMREKYVKQHGRLDEGFRSELSAFSKNNPLFGDQPGYAQAQQAAPASPAASAAPAAAAPAPTPTDAAAAPAAPKRLVYNPATGALE